MACVNVVELLGTLRVEMSTHMRMGVGKGETAAIFTHEILSKQTPDTRATGRKETYTEGSRAHLREACSYVDVQQPREKMGRSKRGEACQASNATLFARMMALSFPA